MWNLLAAAAHSQSVAEKIVEKYTLGSGERERGRGEDSAAVAPPAMSL